jgi:hypothetical protein
VSFIVSLGRFGGLRWRHEYLSLRRGNDTINLVPCLRIVVGWAGVIVTRCDLDRELSGAGATQ